MEVKIGETVNFNGKVLQACESTESNGCKGCFFEDYHPLCSDYVCAAKEREDGKDVIFKETINKTMKIRDEIKDFQSIVQAWVEGKTIQYNFDEGWRDANIEHLLGDISKYRIKPEPKYRPFKNQEECWNEMHNHPDFGWIKSNVTGEYKQIVRMYNYKTELVFNLFNIFSASCNDHSCYSPETIFTNYTFTDGTPFGVKEE